MTGRLLNFLLAQFHLGLNSSLDCLSKFSVSAECACWYSGRFKLKSVFFTYVSGPRIVNAEVDASCANFVEVELTGVGSQGALYGWLQIRWQDVTLGRARTIINREQERQLEQALVRVPFRRNAEVRRRVNFVTRTFRSLALRS